MNLKALFSLSLFCSLSAFAQNSNEKITYLDSLHKPANESNYKYKQVITDHIPEGFEIKTYYKSGKLYKHAISLDKDRMETVKIYYESGKLQTILTKSDISSPTKEFGWYENGQKKLEAESYYDQKLRGFVLRVINYWDKDGNLSVKEGNGIYEELINYEYSKGSYVNSYKQGVWTGYNKEFNFTFTETYKKGKLISGTSIDSDKNEHRYKTIDERPISKNYMSLELFIYKAISSFDPKSKIFNTESEVKIAIDEKGKLIKVEVTADIHKEIPELISTISEQYSEWIPKKYRGIAVSYAASIHPTTREVFITKGD